MLEDNKSSIKKGKKLKEDAEVLVNDILYDVIKNIETIDKRIQN
ncbi:22634_t:CDS:1, partial [Cetraspora pellucida]